MGRRFPLAHDPSSSSSSSSSSSLHSPAPSLLFLVAGIAAVITITTTLCGVRFPFRRRSKPDDPSESSSPKDKASEDLNSTAAPPQIPATESTLLSPPPAQAAGLGSDQKGDDNEAPDMKDLPLPPSKQQMNRSHTNHGFMKKSASTRGIKSAMSLKLPRSMTATRGRKDGDEKAASNIKGKAKPEGSVWMKTIILGEKCKVPDEDEPIVFDRKGKRITTYHPRTKSSVSFSRQNSVNAIQDRENGGTQKEDEELS